MWDHDIVLLNNCSLAAYMSEEEVLQGIIYPPISRLHNKRTFLVLQKKKWLIEMLNLACGIENAGYEI